MPGSNTNGELLVIIGILLIGYGIYVIKNKEGQISLNNPTFTSSKFSTIKGETGVLLGYIYVLVGILLLIAALVQFYILHKYIFSS